MKKIRIAQIGVNRYSHALSIFNSLKTQPELLTSLVTVSSKARRKDSKRSFLFSTVTPS